jgi:hypothetical protein
MNKPGVARRLSGIGVTSGSWGSPSSWPAGAGSLDVGVLAVATGHRSPRPQQPRSSAADRTVLRRIGAWLLVGSYCSSPFPGLGIGQAP